MTACQTCQASEWVYEPASRTQALCTVERSSAGFNCAWRRPKDWQVCGHLLGTWLSWSETRQSVLHRSPIFFRKSVQKENSRLNHSSVATMIVPICFYIYLFLTHSMHHTFNSQYFLFLKDEFLLAIANAGRCLVCQSRHRIHSIQTKSFYKMLIFNHYVGQSVQIYLSLIITVSWTIQIWKRLKRCMKAVTVDRSFSTAPITWDTPSCTCTQLKPAKRSSQ